MTDICEYFENLSIPESVEKLVQKEKNREVSVYSPPKSRLRRVAPVISHVQEKILEYEGRTKVK